MRAFGIFWSLRKEPRKSRKREAPEHIIEIPREAKVQLTQGEKVGGSHLPHWTAGDLVVVDNRCTLHCATPFDAASERRVMYRAVVKGNRWFPRSISRQLHGYRPAGLGRFQKAVDESVHLQRFPTSNTGRPALFDRVKEIRDQGPMIVVGEGHRIGAGATAGAVGLVTVPASVAIVHGQRRSG